MTVRRPLLAVTTLALAAALAACTSTGGDDPTGDATGTAGETAAEETTGPDGGSPGEGATTPTAPAEDTTTTTDDSGVPVAEVGACLRAEDLIAVLTEGGELSGMPTVECSVPHEVEIFASYDLPDGAFPGDEAVQTQAQVECEDRFADYVGVPVTDSSLSVAPITPSAQTWDAGDRTAYCLAVGAEATTSSYEGSGL